MNGRRSPPLPVSPTHVFLPSYLPSPKPVFHLPTFLSCLPLRLPVYLQTILCTIPPTFLPSFLPGHLPNTSTILPPQVTSLPSCLPLFLSSFLSTIRPSYLTSILHCTFLPTSVSHTMSEPACLYPLDSLLRNHRQYLNPNICVLYYFILSSSHCYDGNGWGFFSIPL